MRILLSLMMLIGAIPALAQEALPRLELGVGLFALDSPDYRGSAGSSSYLLPAPYVKYRGDRLRVDEGAQGIIFESPDLLFSMSGNLSLPADEDTPEREGMAELEAILEIGPSINYRLLRLHDSAWWIDLPLRFAYTLDGNLESIGWVFQPRLSWRQPATRLGDWKLRFNIGPLYSSDRHHDYFYTVDAFDATATRPAYEADGGFSGYRAEFTYSRRFGIYWLGGFLRYDNLDHSEIDDSPLVSESDSWMGGIALAWVFHQR
ncbi:MAG: MipA/OmpV family protein [Gammaproteobacteria bacterium]|nr:MipA/OmpV family protein [Gammaproteobacteria bacterium]MDH3449940.1 MipA/OmpV family protein [Gammaproteobacteria bacterium]